MKQLKTAEKLKGTLIDLLGISNLEKLARNKVLPHYRFQDPISKNIYILYLEDEVETWLKENYTNYEKGLITNSYKFLYFNENNYQVSDFEKIPNELQKINNIRQYQTPEAFPPSVYFLCKDSKIKYIGKSTNLQSRIFSHVISDKDFDEVFFITTHIDNLSNLENHLIATYNPPLNKTVGRISEELTCK